MIHQYGVVRDGEWCWHHANRQTRFYIDLYTSAGGIQVLSDNPRLPNKFISPEVQLLRYQSVVTPEKQIPRGRKRAPAISVDKQFSIL